MATFTPTPLPPHYGNVNSLGGMVWQAKDVAPSLPVAEFSFDVSNYNTYYTYQIEVITPKGQIFHTYTPDPFQDLSGGRFALTAARAAQLDGGKSLCYNNQPCLGTTLGRNAVSPSDALGEWRARLYLLVRPTGTRVGGALYEWEWRVVSGVPSEP